MADETSAAPETVSPETVIILRHGIMGTVVGCRCGFPMGEARKMYELGEARFLVEGEKGYAEQQARLAKLPPLARPLSTQEVATIRRIESEQSAADLVGKIKKAKGR